MTSSSPISRALLLSAGLTDLDAARIGALASADRATSTRVTYASAWRVFARWCAARGVAALPAEPVVVAAYIAERAEAGLRVGSMELACAAIGYQHRELGFDDPIADPLVGRVRRGLRRTRGVAPRRPARPLLIKDIRSIVAAIDTTTVAGVRDKALILLGFAGAFRRSELAALQVADLDLRAGGVLVIVRRSKGDQDGRGQVLAVARGRRAERHGSIDRSRRMARRARPRTGEPVPVRAARRRPHRRPAGRPGDPQDRQEAGRGRRHPARDDLHALAARRAATTAAAAHVGLDRIAAQTRHRHVSTLVQHYIRPANAMATTSSRELGL